MYAIVEIAGQQFKVEEGKKIFVHRLESGGGETVDFDKVLLIEDGDNVIIGEPTIKDAVVEGKILDHVRGDKVIVFKKKRRKGYRVKKGHRQNFTQIEIINILKDKSASGKAALKTEEPKVTRSKVSEEPVKDSKETPKKAAAKKPAAKKEVKEKSPAKKAVEKKPEAKKSSKGKKE
ncbi:MAG TPA: 50S ribosomal protein L21 [Bacteroidales bacterium]|nr:50S ribosomal protein L21 [Bacteroidales bacterium]